MGPKFAVPASNFPLEKIITCVEHAINVRRASVENKANIRFVMRRKESI